MAGRKLRSTRSLALAAMAFALLALAPAGAGAQSIVNSTQWLEGNAVSASNSSSSSRARISLLVNHARNRTVTGIQIDDDWNSTSNDIGSKPLVTVTPQRPSGEFNFSRVNHTAALNTENTGVSGLGFTGCGTNRTNKKLYVRAKLDDGTFTPVAETDIRLLRTDANTCDDFAYLFDQTQTATTAAPGQNVSFTFKGDDTDSPVTGNRDWTGYRWRWRRLNDGATSSSTTVCPNASLDNTSRTVTTSFPQRGRYVVEAVLASGNGGSCNYPNTDDWHYIGAVDVNTLSDSPTASLSIPRPNVGQTITATATLDDDDTTGAPQMVEWDADGDSTYERRELGTPAITTAMRQQAINTTGMTPGVKTVRVRVTDNGALNGADNIRRTATATATFRVDAPPQAVGQQLVTWEGDAIPATLAATDADGDPITYAITEPPAHGQLSAQGTERTYTPDPGFSGTDTFKFRASDGFGGSHEVTTTITVHPDTEIVSGPEGFSRQTSATFGFADHPGIAFDCKLDDGAYGSCTNPAIFNSLEDGDHEITVRGRDASGNVDTTPATRQWTVYTGPLRTIFKSGPQPFTQSGDAAFTFEATEPDSTFSCKLDEEAAEACASGKSYADLGEGIHTLRVIATSPGGTVESPGATYTWTVDRTPPQTTLGERPAAETNAPTARFTFGSEAGARFECSVGDAAFAPCTTGHELAGLTDGSKRFRVRAVDAAGNADPTPAEHTWIVDTDPPGVSFDSAPDGTYAVDDLVADFASDDDEAFFECRLDDAEFARCFAPHRLEDVADGEHTFEVRAGDRAGNRSEPLSSTFTVDTVAPQTAFTEGPNGPRSTNEATFEFGAEGATSYQCSLDQGAWEDCTSPKTLTGLAQGPHDLRVRAKDAAGNVEQTPATRAWSVDTTAPVVAIGGAPAARTTDANPAFTFSVPGEDDATFECALQFRTDASAWPEPSWGDCTTLGATNVEREYRLAARATDAVGNPGPAQFVTWTLDTTAPKTTLSGLPSGTTTQTSATATFTASEPVDRFECRLDGGTWKVCTSQHQLTGLDDGDHVFEVEAIDVAGNREQLETEDVAGQARARWRVDTLAPQTKIDDGPSGVVRSSQARFAFAASKSPATFTCKVDSRAPVACTSPHTVTGLGDGEHTIEITATSGGVTEPTPVRRTWRVDSVAPDTRITSGPPARGTAVDAAFGLTATEPGAGFQCRLDGGAWKGCPSPARLTGLTVRDHTLEARAVDEAGNVDGSPASYRWTVTAPPGGGTAPPPQDGGSDSKSCTVNGGTGCKPPTAKLRLVKGKGGVRGAALTITGGDADLASLRATLPGGLPAAFAKRSRGKTVGRLVLRKADGTTLSSGRLRLPKSARRGTATLLRSGTLRVKLKAGRRPVLSASGLPAGVRGVALRLSGGRTSVLRVRKACASAKRAKVKLVDRSGATRTLKGDAACGRSATKKKGGSR